MYIVSNRLYSVLCRILHMHMPYTLNSTTAVALSGMTMFRLQHLTVLQRHVIVRSGSNQEADRRNGGQVSVCT